MKLYLLPLFYSMLGLSLGALALRSLVAPPPDRDRMAMDKVRPECEVLFVGPSFVKSQIHTELVEAEAARLGHPLRACKYAKAGLKGFEQYHTLRELMAQSWPQLKLVLFDITLGGDSGYSLDNRFKPRIIRFHVPEIFSWYYEFWDEQQPPLGHARQLFDHGLHALARALHVGVGAEHLLELSPQTLAAVVSSPPPTTQQAEKVRKSGKAKKHKVMSEREYKDRLKKMDKKARRLAKKQPRLSADKRAFLLHEYAIFQERGVRAEALLAPTWSPHSAGYGKLGRSGPKVHNFSTPKKYPSLYAKHSHKRDGHLTRKGSEEYSRLLARLIVKRLEKQP